MFSANCSVRADQTALSLPCVRSASMAADGGIDGGMRSDGSGVARFCATFAIGVGSAAATDAALAVGCEGVASVLGGKGLAMWACVDWLIDALIASLNRTGTAGAVG